MIFPEAARSQSRATQKKVDADPAAAGPGAIDLIVENVLDTGEEYDVWVDGGTAKLKVTSTRAAVSSEFPPAYTRSLWCPSRAEVLPSLQRQSR